MAEPVSKSTLCFDHDSFKTITPKVSSSSLADSHYKLTSNFPFSFSFSFYSQSKKKKKENDILESFS